ncbi:hypothetical protein C7414_102404 [Cupriavidus alkaliphilus]|uniref:hypothetical protein n=1 Tax=Cupriavidus alkaliphilus TaxID=942866 RepID=UPI000DE5D292|nr:hypothetical protein [Cupriavidus alkaliphilus]PVY81075.1 hypothetical protein C7414_102404 [Cupriavidus alkaliphilus]
MNPRIYKKQAKRAVELLRSFGETPEFVPSTDESLVYDVLGWKGRQKMRRTDPACLQAWERIKGVPVHWYRCSYEYDEWDFETAIQYWVEWHYWGCVVPDDFNGDRDELPRITFKQRRARLTTKAIAPGWRWRGGRAVRK